MTQLGERIRIGIMAACVMAPVSLIAVLAPGYASRYAGFDHDIDLPEATQWALRAYPYTLLFTLGIVPVYLLSRLEQGQQRERKFLRRMVIALIVLETLWSLSVWYPLWLPLHKLAEIV